MKLKVLSPFQSPGLLIQTEMPVHRPRGYAGFWDRVATAYGELSEDPPWRRHLGTLRFTHATPFLSATGNRYRSIDAGSLTRPLHFLEVVPQLSAQPSNLDLGGMFEQALDETAPAADASTSRLLAPLVDGIRKQPPRLLIRVHDHTISLIEGDLDLGNLLFEIPEEEMQIRDPDDDAHLPVLDHLQQAAITWTERVIRMCQEEILGPLFAWILTRPEAEVYLRGDTASYQAAADPTVAYQPEPSGSRGGRTRSPKAGAAGTPPGATACNLVLWVTRTLVFERESGDRKAREDRREHRRELLIRYWLKDIDGPDEQGKLEEVVQSSEAYSMRWLNYLFREDAYPARSAEHSGDKEREHGWVMPEGRPARPFCHPWEAMLYSQFYYAAFDVVQTRIYRVLAHSFTPESRQELRCLKDDLDEMVKESTLLILDYQENLKYYQRSVRATMKDILTNWELESVLLMQVRGAVEACNERVEELHKRATARSSVYTDLILLAIGVTSVFGILLALLEYGRTLALDANLTVYERGSFNFVDWIAAHSTDGILLVAAILSAALVGLYWYFKRQQLL